MPPIPLLSRKNPLREPLMEFSRGATGASTYRLPVGMWVVGRETVTEPFWHKKACLEIEGTTLHNSSIRNCLRQFVEQSMLEIIETPIHDRRVLYRYDEDTGWDYIREMADAFVARVDPGLLGFVRPWYCG